LGKFKKVDQKFVEIRAARNWKNFQQPQYAILILNLQPHSGVKRHAIRNCVQPWLK